MGVGSVGRQRSSSRAIWTFRSPNEAMQKNPPQIPADFRALSTPKFNGAWVFTDNNNRSAWTRRRTSSCLARYGRSSQRQDRRKCWLRPLCRADRNGSPGIANTLAADARGALDSFQTSTPLPNVEGRPQATLANPFPSTRIRFCCRSARVTGRIRMSVTPRLNWPDQNYRAQTNDRMNFTIMREIPGQFKVDATWFMNFGRNVPQICNG